MLASGIDAQVVLRYFWGDSILHALPMRVVEHAPQRIALWIAARTPCKRPTRRLTLAERAHEDWTLGDRPWSTGFGTLILYVPGRAHAIWLFWNEGGSFTGWYVNLEEPWRRTSVGFDTRDHILDLAIEPSGRWRWMDENELEEATQLGFFSQDDANEIRSEGERVLADWPFPTGWEDWHPDPRWPLGRLPKNWDVPRG